MRQEPAIVSSRMARVRSKDTKPELSLRRALFRRGLRFRVHDTRLAGHPDIVFPSARICVFVDGEFWHGHRWGQAQRTIKVRRAYWVPKIEGNMARDRRVNRTLRAKGWLVIRFWARAVERNPERCVARVCRAYQGRIR